LYGGSFGLLVSDHSAVAVDRFMNAVVSRGGETNRTGTIKPASLKPASLWSCVR
jgi:hypothetical protein